MSDSKREIDAGAGTAAGPLPDEGLPGLCRHLRTKRYYYGTIEETLETADLSTTAQFWCLRTMRVIGPDESPVTPGACRAGRGCCEATGA
jgi:hypothetical protein